MISTPASHAVPLAVVTRTKNRPFLLRRAMESVAGQTAKPFVWVVVNDGGDPEPVDAVVAEARRRGVPCRVVHHDRSLGMEAASNAGLAVADSEMVAIHDDDDSWDPRFVHETLSHLDRNPSKAGVVTGTMKIVERIDGEGNVLRLRSRPFNPELRSVHLSEMAERNLFPPISFVYRRRVLDAIGAYDPSLPVLGDWDFNLRFLSKYDIGVHPEFLANYHFRPAQKGAAGNSVGSGIDLHVEWDAVIRNRLLRQDLEAGIVGLGHLVASGRRSVTLDKTLQPIALVRALAKQTYHRFRSIAPAAA